MTSALPSLPNGTMEKSRQLGGFSTILLLPFPCRWYCTSADIFAVY